MMRGRQLTEHHVQLIWEKQYVHRDQLVTTDGRPVHVVDPGRVSLDPGPDIRGARIRIAGTLFAGDIEIHRTAPEWVLHGHQHDPRYNSVILHVLFHQPPRNFLTQNRNGRVIPMLSIRDVLVRPLEEVQKDAVLDVMDLRSGRLACSGQHHLVPTDVLRAFLDRLAIERMEIKLRRFEERLYDLVNSRTRSALGSDTEVNVSEGAGLEVSSAPATDIPTLEMRRREIWEQLLYEGCMEALGYSRNRRPFIRLAQVLPLDRIKALTSTSTQTEAILLGTAGLLSSHGQELDVEARTYLHDLQHEWRRIRSHTETETLLPSEWVHASGRPANAPLVRLVAAHVLVRKILDHSLFLNLLRTVKDQTGNVRSILHALLRVDPGPFWERRVSFQRVVPGTVQPLGEVRKDDLIVNIIAPLFLLYARIFRDSSLRTGVLSMLSRYPPLQPNAVTRRISAQVFRKRVLIRSALDHQAVIQLFNYYCREGGCGECVVGRAVWG